MGRLSEEKLLKLINEADSIVSDREVFADLISVSYSDLPLEPTDEELVSNADNPHVVVDDMNSDGHSRMSIEIQRHATVYQDCEDGCIYPDELSDEPYSDAVQDALVERDAAFRGNGFLHTRKSDLALFASFVSQLLIDHSEIVLRSDLEHEEEE